MRQATCRKCKHKFVMGDWPFCPHGRPSGGIIDDTLPGGARWMHNLGAEPVWVETKTQYRKELADRGLVQAERRVYNHDDRSPWASKHRLRPGARDPFIHPAAR